MGGTDKPMMCHPFGRNIGDAHNSIPSLPRTGGLLPICVCPQRSVHLPLLEESHFRVEHIAKYADEIIQSTVSDGMISMVKLLQDQERSFPSDAKKCKCIYETVFFF